MSRALQEWFGVTPAASRVADALLGADGRPLPIAVLADAAGQTVNGAYLSIKFLRAAMEPGSIANQRDRQGFSLTEIGMADCRRALSSLQDERSAA